MNVLQITKMKINIIIYSIKDIIFYLKYTQIYILFIVLIVKRIYVFIINKNMMANYLISNQTNTDK